MFERFLAPAFNLLLDREALLHYRNSIDWEQARDRLERPNFSYPSYYQQQNFHGIKGGYLTPDAAVTYDPVTQYVLPPNETWVRQALVERVQVKPRRILDLGCGTGSTTLLLKQAFPEAEVIGVDLSPYMLKVAEDKAQRQGLEIAFIHGQAETTGLPAASFDLVTASLLFHETPPQVSERILQEALRLLTSGGEVLILDGSQATLRQATWLMDIFEEPYIQDYAQHSVDAWLGAVGFGAVRTETVWWVHQVSRGVKPITGRKPQWSVNVTEITGATAGGVA
ncbi:MAG: methyltransferase domain-containing protein [Leptolyngbyaceae cyanobacterium SM1_1_3]|nr:methyltransferase domain-containing protein [Leptolyngbyaceae cyanobacterium SM1_1_3]